MALQKKDHVSPFLSEMVLIHFCRPDTYSQAQSEQSKSENVEAEPFRPW